MHDNSPNDTTIKVYDQNIKKYLEQTPSKFNITHRPLIKWIDLNLSYLKNGARILEIGSGPGRDASYMRKRGFNVHCSDASQAFVTHLQSLGKKVTLINIITDSILDNFDMVYANAVFPHFTESDTLKALKNIRGMLKKKGILALSIKQGNGEVWVNEKLHQKRYVHYWEPSEFIKTVNRNGYKLLYIDRDIPGDLTGHVWTLLTFEKS
jgi:2-polyprenyl-3-methyl-5-hydroxy-6-metoxy-1,4-benzoquinol methylase